jgi:predicted nucleotidyltransferase
MDMSKKINDKLYEIEKKHNIKILYAVESGSRGWGFASPDSDYDARFIYIHPVEWYLSIKEKRDFIEYPLDEVFDINGWDIRKALKLFYKSNPPLMEWLTSPIIYREYSSLAGQLRELMPQFFALVPTLYHYLHIAKGKWHEIKDQSELKIKKYFYILRPLAACKWILTRQGMPPMEFHKMLESLELDKSIVDEINNLLKQKAMSDESTIIERSPVLYDFFEKEIDSYDLYLKSHHNEVKTDTQLLDELFMKILFEVQPYGLDNQR